MENLEELSGSLEDTLKKPRLPLAESLGELRQESDSLILRSILCVYIIPDDTTKLLNSVS